MFERYKEDQLRHPTEEDIYWFREQLVPLGASLGSLGRVRNIGYHKNAGVYKLNDFIRTHYNTVYRLILHGAHDIKVLEPGKYAVKQVSQWTILEVNVWEFTGLFPQGIPRTDRQMRVWISYVGYIAHNYYRELANQAVEEEKMEAQVEAAKKVLSAIDFDKSILQEAIKRI